MNVHLRYNGGVAAYFNGRLVARFNLDASFNKDTEAPSTHDSSKYSAFHVILATSGATLEENVIAFELHRAVDVSSATPVEFDASGIFGVEDCSMVVDSYSSITGTSPSSNALEDAFDMEPSSFMNLPKTEGNIVEWIVENLEGSRFNSYGIYFGLSIDSISWTLQGRFDSNQDYNQLDKKTGLAIVNRRLDTISVPVAYAGFKYYRWTMDTATTAVPRISEFIFQYCKPSGEGVCPGVGDYPSVSEGEISPSSCPDMYEGYSYRLCENNVLSEIHTEHCSPKVPANLHYAQEHYIFVMNTNVFTDTPTFDNIIDSFFVDEGVLLPEGLELDTTTGIIRGKPITVVDGMVFTIYGKNEKGATFTNVTISVRKGMCKADGHFEATPVDEMFVYECSKGGSFIGSQTRQCVLGEVDGVWEAAKGSCIAVSVIVVVVIVVVVVLVAIFIIIGRIVKKGKEKRGNVEKKSVV